MYNMYMVLNVFYEPKLQVTNQVIYPFHYLENRFTSHHMTLAQDSYKKDLKQRTTHLLESTVQTEQK